MEGLVELGQLCTIEPVHPASVSVGDIVLCKVNGRKHLHLIKIIQGQRFQIGNNRGRINGWVAAGAIFGRRVRVESPAAVEPPARPTEHRTRRPNCSLARHRDANCF
jgi:hypothetical protein